MYFGKMRHRIVLMKKKGTTRNSMNEEVPAYEVYHPGLKLLVVYEDSNEQGAVFWRTKDEGNAEIVTDRNGRPYAHKLEESEWAYWAEVKPTTGREYEEAQKIRAETTYNVYMRYLPGLTYDMFITYNGKTLKIESIIDVEERHKIINLVCSEVLR